MDRDSVVWRPQSVWTMEFFFATRGLACTPPTLLPAGCSGSQLQYVCMWSRAGLMILPSLLHGRTAAALFLRSCPPAGICDRFRLGPLLGRLLGPARGRRGFGLPGCQVDWARAGREPEYSAGKWQGMRGPNVGVYRSLGEAIWMVSCVE